MPGAKSFEELWIWQQARELANLVYADFGTGTSASKDYRFLDQIRGAAMSVMNNIAEGFERDTKREFAHFLGIAKGSCGEVRSLYYLAEDQDYTTARVAEERRSKAATVGWDCLSEISPCSVTRFASVATAMIRSSVLLSLLHSFTHVTSRCPGQTYD